MNGTFDTPKLRRRPTPDQRVRPIPGWDEIRRHPDGVSFWLRGELHRADGFAIVRRERREVWLHGVRIGTPDHDPKVPLHFVGQVESGELWWADRAGAVRAVTVYTAAGVIETRWYERSGEDEPHWTGGYSARRVLPHGETRYFNRSSSTVVPTLHREDGPAVEASGDPIQSVWWVDGKKVDGPLELLIREAHRIRSGTDERAPTPEEKARLWLTVKQHPESQLAAAIADAFPEGLLEAVREGWV